MSIADPRLTDQDRDLLYLIVISLMKSRITNHLDVKFYGIDIISYGFYLKKKIFGLTIRLRSAVSHFQCGQGQVKHYQAVKHAG